MSIPTMKPAEAQAHATFLALMWGLAHPGQGQACAPDGATTTESLLAIGAALLDLETSFYSSDPILLDGLARTTARPAAPEDAKYHFYPELAFDRLAEVASAPAGTMLYPNQSATLIIGCQIGTGPTFQLSGPGIATSQTVRLGALPGRFWQLREKACQYPLGWDVFFVAGATLIGLPRTTQIAIGE